MVRGRWGGWLGPLALTCTNCTNCTKLHLVIVVQAARFAPIHLHHTLSIEEWCSWCNGRGGWVRGAQPESGATRAAVAGPTAAASPAPSAWVNQAPLPE